MQARLIQKTLTFIACPGCGDAAHDITELMESGERLAGPMFCASCGTGVHVQFGEFGEIDVERWNKRRRDAVVVLASRGPVYLVVRGPHTPEGVLDEGNEFLFGGQRPSEYLKDIEQIIPESPFAFVATLKAPANSQLSEADILKVISCQPK